MAKPTNQAEQVKQGEELRPDKLEACRRFLNHYCIKLKNGKPIKLPTGRVHHPPVNERRTLGEHFEHLREVTEDRRSVLLEQFKIALRQLLRAQAYFLHAPAQEVRKLILEVLEEELVGNEERVLR